MKREKREKEAKDVCETGYGSMGGMSHTARILTRRPAHDGQSSVLLIIFIVTDIAHS